MKRSALLASIAVLTACGGPDESVAEGYGDYSGGYEGYDGYYDGETGGAGDGDGDGDGDEDEAGEETPEETDTDTEGQEQCNTLDDVVLYLSPDDSNSMSAPVQVREHILNGHSWGYELGSRVWEFMNYYSFDEAPAPDGTLAITAALRKSPVTKRAEERYELVLSVASERMNREDRPAMNVTFVLDTSGSMAGEEIELLRESCRAIVASLRAGDTVSMVEWDVSDTWVLTGHQVAGPNDPTVLEAIDDLVVSGSTNLNGGLVSGYKLAQENWDPNAINRLVLISDGGANAGVTDIDLIAQNAVYGGSDGIYLVGVGVGDAYNDQLMDTVTDAGKGASVYISDEGEAWKMFHTDFISTMAVAARNVQIELQLPPSFDVVKFSGEEISTDPQEVEPQHLAPNDSMVLYQQLRTCAPELVGDDSEITVTARWEDVATFEPREISRTYTLGQLLAIEDPSLAKSAAIVAYTDVLIQISKNNQEAIAVASAAAEAALDHA